ncbi:MAG: bifunctional YncE family protein/alkaline phosphatase family protein [Acidobacteriota bacterium]|nr:bifunctional YncE family protein/alkaline phosphatase family protein [Acidobacteriota bacterium]
MRAYSLIALSLAVVAAMNVSAQTKNLPTSKMLTEPVPGTPQSINSLPMSMATSPDGRYVATVNAGYGTYESDYDQSLAVLDTRTGKVEDFPDSRTLVQAKQTLFSGLAFSRDGKHLYASIGSISDPLGEKKGDTGSGVVVYRFDAGKISPERILKLPLQQLAPGHTTQLLNDKPGNKGIPFPAAIADVTVHGAERLLVADNLSDDVLLLDPATGKIEHRFDLAENDAVPSVYPIALAVAKDGKRAFVALWNASEIVELNLQSNTVERKLALLKPASKVAPGTHPCAFALTADGKTLYVALSNRDAVAAVNVARGALEVKGYFDTRLPGQSYFGAEPVSVALNADGSRLYVANAASDAVAVMDTRKLTKGARSKGMVEPVGFIPTEWMPMCVTYLTRPEGAMLYVATAKGKGTGPNDQPMPASPNTEGKRFIRAHTYIASMLHGSLAAIDAGSIDGNLKEWTDAVLSDNRMKAAQESIEFTGRTNPIKHVIYIIKENRTYDQVLGDLKQNDEPVGNGDPKLTMYGESITPNVHKLALQFGVLDNFYDSGEVSGDGHVWSNAAIGTDYLEKTWQQSYRGGQRTYDYEGVVAEGLPLEQNIPDVNEPASGYLWGDLAAHHKSYYHFGEYIATKFCDEERTANPQQGPMLQGQSCAHPAVKPGQELPAAWGGGVNKWPWAIPMIASNTATKPELVGHFAKEAPDFNLWIPDQIRVNIFERHLKGWIEDLKNGKDTMPEFVMLRLGNDHTMGTRPGGPTPRASVADNDLAIGRAVDLISHSPYWGSTAFFILEDDAQDGADHVDAHRSYALVISKYAPRGKDGHAFVDSHFYSTVSVIRTMESLLGLPPMNNNDAFAPLIGTLFTGPGDQAPYEADASNRENGLIYTANTKKSPGAAASLKMDFRHADRAPAQQLNVILWKAAKGDAPVPAMITAKKKAPHKDDDDD